jgi:signal transduction histidine kinase
LGKSDGDQFKVLTRSLANSSSDIADASGAIMDINDNVILAHRAAAMARGRRAIVIALGIAGLSLVIYIWTSIRLTQGMFAPLRQLRDSIVKVSQRQFDMIVPLEGGEELQQIATTFNQMAAELRAYIAESDQRAIEANRVSRAILEALPYPIYIVDEDYAVRVMNPRAEMLSSMLEIPGALPGAVRKSIDEAAALGCELIDDDLKRAVEIPLPNAPSEAPPTYLPQVFRMTAAPGASAGWAVLLMDVTKLRQFDLAKTKAILTLGHELKTPVTSIRMTLHLLLEEKIGALTPDQRELVTVGRDDCERLLTVLQSLLELARHESGRVTMKLTPTAPADLLAQTEAMHGEFIRRSGAQFTVEPMPPALPLVPADAIHVVRVLGNFLNNAAKYGTPGVPVAMRAELRSDGFVRLCVRNHSPRPLSEAEQARVFDPFYRRAGEGAEGSGVGLTICREIAAAHRGRIGVWSEDGQVEFYLDLRVVSSKQTRLNTHVSGSPITALSGNA